MSTYFYHSKTSLTRAILTCCVSFPSKSQSLVGFNVKLGHLFLRSVRLVCIINLSVFDLGFVKSLSKIRVIYEYCVQIALNVILTQSSCNQWSVVEFS